MKYHQMKMFLLGTLELKIANGKVTMDNGKWKIKVKHWLVTRIWHNNISALRLYGNEITAAHINTSPTTSGIMRSTVICINYQ